MVSKASKTAEANEPDVSLVSTSYGGKVAVHDFGGNAEGGRLLFLPANGFHGLCYRALAGHLRKQVHCYALDFPDQGRSSPAPGEQNLFEYFVTATKAVLEYMRLEGCCVFGHSSGGLTATLVQLRWPGSFSSMMLYEAVIHPHDSPWNRDGINPVARVAIRRRAAFSSKAAALANFASKHPFQWFRSDALHCYVAHGMQDQADGTARLRCSPQAEARCYNAVDGICEQAWPHLCELKVPVTVACGLEEATELFGNTQAASPSIAEQIPGCRLEKYRHLQHLGPMEDPGFVATRVLVHLRAASEPRIWVAMARKAVVDLAGL